MNRYLRLHCTLGFSSDVKLDSHSWRQYDHNHDEKGRARRRLGYWDDRLTGTRSTPKKASHLTHPHLWFGTHTSSHLIWLTLRETPHHSYPTTTLNRPLALLSLVQKPHSPPSSLVSARVQPSISTLVNFLLASYQATVVLSSSPLPLPPRQLTLIATSNLQPQPLFHHHSVSCPDLSFLVSPSSSHLSYLWPPLVEPQDLPSSSFLRRLLQHISCDHFDDT